MEPNQVTPSTYEGDNGCAKCGSPQFEDGYKVKLCKECRRELSRYPVKKAVIWAAIGVGLLVLVSLYKFPRSFKAGLSYERAIRYEEQHKYMSAEKELRKTLAAYPEYAKGSAHFMIAAFYNDHLLEADSASSRWAGYTSKDDDELIGRVNDVLSARSYYYFVDSSFAARYDSVRTDTIALRAALAQYLLMNSNDVLASYLLASSYYDGNDYPKTDSICEALLKEAPDFHPTYPLLAASYREEKKFDAAIGVCNKLLRHNAESIAGNVTLIKILLKQKEDKKALEKALAIFPVAPDHPFVLQSLVMACHYNHRTKERDQYLAMLRHNADTSGLGLAQQVIQGKFDFRD